MQEGLYEKSYQCSAEMGMYRRDGVIRRIEVPADNWGWFLVLK